MRSIRWLALWLAPLVSARVQFLGVAIAGGDFGCQINGNCPTGSVQLPLSGSGGGDGEGQMRHFRANSQMNMFRLPISWQYLVNNNLGGPLDTNNFGRYDRLMQACLSTGAHCMIDIHNFARWNDGIIGQGGPTDDQFVSLWRQLAERYAASDRVVFELMNEPHHLDIAIWAQTCQKVVNAIRNAGAKSQMILLPGTNFDSAATLVSSGSAEALMALRNPDGSTDGLLLDIHKYLDVDNSGTHGECVTDNVDAFAEVADFLRRVGRLGLVSETGASREGSCMQRFCAQNSFINANSDVFVGLVGWAAGSFSTSYILSLTPSRNGNSFVDNALMSQCVVSTWLNAEENPVPPPPRPVSSSSSSPSAGATPTSSASGGVGRPTGISGGGNSTNSSGTAVSPSPGATGTTTPGTATNTTASGQTPSPTGGSGRRGVMCMGLELVLLGVAAAIVL